MEKVMVLPEKKRSASGSTIGCGAAAAAAAGDAAGFAAGLPDGAAGLAAADGLPAGAAGAAGLLGAAVGDAAGAGWHAARASVAPSAHTSGERQVRRRVRNPETIHRIAFLLGSRQKELVAAGRVFHANSRD